MFLRRCVGTIFQHDEENGGRKKFASVNGWSSYKISKLSVYRNNADKKMGTVRSQMRLDTPHRRKMKFLEMDSGRLLIKKKEREGKRHEYRIRQRQQRAGTL
jgi:hypothetical protein